MWKSVMHPFWIGGRLECSCVGIGSAVTCLSRVTSLVATHTILQSCACKSCCVSAVSLLSLGLQFPTCKG